MTVYILFGPMICGCPIHGVYWVREVADMAVAQFRAAGFEVWVTEQVVLGAPSTAWLTR